MRGKFITLEGLDGAGKSTHLGWLRAFLEHRGLSLCVTREPGGTPLGETLRTLLLDRTQRLHPETEALLMFAARREHLDKIVLPALESGGTWVLCDRFTDASYAYQAAGSGVDWDKIAALESWVHHDLQPNLTLYFDVSPEIARSRAEAIKTPDRFEQEREAFHARVRAGYLRRAAEDPRRMCVIDASRSLDAIQSELEGLLEGLLADDRGRS